MRLEDWKESLSCLARGCGCLSTIALSFLCFALIGGALMGDYFGPPEGIEEDHRTKARVISMSFASIVVLTVAGCWFVTKRRP